MKNNNPVLLHKLLAEKSPNTYARAHTKSVQGQSGDLHKQSLLEGLASVAALLKFVS